MGPGQFVHRGLALGEADQDGPSGRIGKSGEGETERVVGHCHSTIRLINSLVDYVPPRAVCQPSPPHASERPAPAPRPRGDGRGSPGAPRGHGWTTAAAESLDSCPLPRHPPGPPLTRPPTPPPVRPRRSPPSGPGTSRAGTWSSPRPSPGSGTWSWWPSGGTTRTWWTRGCRGSRPGPLMTPTCASTSCPPSAGSGHRSGRSSTGGWPSRPSGCPRSDSATSTVYGDVGRLAGPLDIGDRSTIALFLVDGTGDVRWSGSGGFVDKTAAALGEVLATVG